MFFRVVLFVWQFVLDLVAVLRMTDDEKDLEIMLLRQQLRIVERERALGAGHPFELSERDHLVLTGMWLRV